MKQKFAIFDLDGTLYRWQLYHEVVFELKRRDYFPVESAQAIDEAFAAWANRESSFEHYERLVTKVMEESLTQFPPHILDEVARDVADRTGRKTYVYTTQLVKKLQKQGYFLLAVSGSQQEVAELFARRLGFDDCIGSLYERKDGQFTGVITRFVPGNKASLIHKYIATHNVTLDDSIAVGDSSSDIAMLELVTHPIAFNPNDKLLETARQRGWKIVVERKNIAYTLEPGESGQFTLTDTDIY